MRLEQVHDELDEGILLLQATLAAEHGGVGGRTRAFELVGFHLARYEISHVLRGAANSRSPEAEPEGAGAAAAAALPVGVFFAGVGTEPLTNASASDSSKVPPDALRGSGGATTSSVVSAENPPSGGATRVVWRRAGCGARGGGQAMV